MQLTNGAIKVGVQPPPMNPTAVEEYEGVDLDTFDLSAFAKPAKVRTASAAGTDVLSNNPEVQKSSPKVLSCSSSVNAMKWKSSSVATTRCMNSWLRSMTSPCALKTVVSRKRS